MEDGAVIATNRWGRSRAFPLVGAENSPACAGSGLAEGGDYWFEDRSGRVLILLDFLNWDDDDLRNFEQAAGLDHEGLGHHVLPLGEPLPPKRPDVFRVMDPPYLIWLARASAIGSTAVALNWLKIAPESVMKLVALPCLVVAIWAIWMLKRTWPVQTRPPRRRKKNKKTRKRR